MGSKRLQLVYPSVKRDDKIVKFAHGEQITDRYHWLEDIDSLEVKGFANCQNELTATYLEKCPEIEKLQSNLRSMSSHRKISCPTEHVGTDSLHFFVNVNGEGRSAPGDSLWVQRGLKGTPEIVLSPCGITNVSHEKQLYIRMFSLSYDGQTMAYAFSTKDSKWWSIKFREVANAKDLPERLTNVCMSDISWTADGKGILYSCYNDQNAVNHQIVFHRIGTDQLDDLVLVAFPDRPAMTLQAQISDCGEMIFVYAQANDKLQHMHFFYGDFFFTVEENYHGTPLLFHLLEGNALEIQYITNVGSKVFFRTNNHAPNFEIVSINLSVYNRKASHSWRTVIEECADRILDWAVCVKTDYLMVCYLQHATHHLELHTLKDGALLHRYALPVGTIKDYFGYRDCPRFYFTFTSFVTPDCVHYIEVAEGFCQKLNPWGHRVIKIFNNDIAKEFNTSGYVVKQLICENPADDEEILMFIIHKKGIKLNGSSPCMMYAQGCFGNQVMPSFSISKWAFLRYFGGVVAVVGVRGGGEYGEKWHDMGCGIHKQNTYDDFIVATEYLIQSGYTSPSKLILAGEGYGGNLAAVCLTQRPELYAAVIIHNGLLDMLRFHLFPESRKYLSEFGDPNVASDFDILRKTSPLHNVFLKGDNFPAVLALIGQEKSFSHPSNSYKFVAQIQSYLVQRPNCTSPCLLRSRLGNPLIEYCCGVEVEVPEETVLKIEERVDIFAFLIQSLGLKLIEK